MRLAYIATVLLAVCGIARAAEKPDDAAITKKLVGTWTTCLGGGAAEEVDGKITYAENNTFVADGRVKLGDDTADVKVEGTWKVEGGAVVVTVAKSSHPGLAPVGSVVKETVVAIDDKAMRIKRGVGKERERKRVGG